MQWSTSGADKSRSLSLNSNLIELQNMVAVCWSVSLPWCALQASKQFCLATKHVLAQEQIGSQV